MDDNWMLLWGCLVLLLIAVTAVIVLFRQRQRLQQDLLQLRSEHALQPSLLVVLDATGRVVGFNHAHECFPLDPALRFTDLLDDTNATPMAMAIDRALSYDRPEQLELSVCIETGVVHWLCHIQPLPASPEVQGSCSSPPRSSQLLLELTDISLFQRRVAVAEQERLAAEQANLARSRFLANMSHEIRTPMTGVLGMVSLMDQTELTPEQRSYQRVIHSSSEHLLAIINDILDLSKIDAGKLSIEVEPFNLNELIDNLLNMMANRAREKQLVLQSFIDQKLPRFLIGDVHRIRQILINYLNNAIKFTDQGHVLLRVVEVEREDSHVNLRFSVEDSGIGIGTERVISLFDEYTFAHGRISTEAGGTGLGLSICKRLATLMDGYVGVTSTPGRGSGFWFDITLPVAAGGIEENAEDALLPTLGRVLWICDELQVNRSLLLAVGRNLGMKTREFSNSGDLMHLAATQKADIIIISRRCWEEAVPEFLALLDSRQVRVAMTSSDLLNIPADTLLNAGIGACWDWPISQDMLRDILVRLLAEPLPVTYLVSRNNRYQNMARNLSSGRIPFEGRYVLLAEDNPVNQKVASQMLERLGCRVDIANNGRDALEMAVQNRYDLILMDCHMPVMDGLESCRLIRRAELQQVRPAVPIVALSADVMAERKTACEEAGMNGYLSKPIRLEDLRRELPRFMAEVPAAGKGQITLPQGI